MLQIKINGKTHSFQKETSLLKALQSLGVEVPALCDDPRLKPFGGCRMCVVQIKGQHKPVTACNTPLEEGMIVETHSPEIEHFRKECLKFLAHKYPKEAVQKYPEKEFHRLLKAYGVENDCEGSPRAELRDDSHPYLHVDMSQCIYCLRCARICNEVQGQMVWEVLNRGEETRIKPDSNTTLVASSCVSCGACVDSCPTGALEDQSILKFGTATRWTKTTCPYCGVGCEMKVGVREERIVEVKPVLESPVNKGHLCVKGRYAFDFVHAEDRITEPMIRKNGEWKKVSWDEAIAFTSKGLKKLLEQYGPDSIGVLGSARATNEENYVAQKFARVVLGTHNVDCCARVCHTPTAAAMKKMLGTGAATNSFDDVEEARTILIVGTNTTENHPIVGARIKQQALKGAKLIIIDPRKIELTQYAAFHLALRPGTNVPLLNALAHTIVEEKLYDEEFLRDRVSEWEEFKKFVGDFSPEKVSEICGVEADLIRKAARLYATEKPSMCLHGLGMTEHVQGTEGVMCLVNLALITGNMGNPGTGINPLRGQNNVQGSAHMGCDPSILTGSISIKEGKEFFEKAWKTTLSPVKGLNLMEMMDAAAEGKLKGLWVMGYDVYLTNANEPSTRKAFENLELVIVQDLFMNETAKLFGNVFFPAASSFEKDGTFMNSERRIQKIRKVLEAPGGAKTDWEIVCEVAQAMGKKEGFDYSSAEEIWNEIREVWPAGRGITYARIEKEGLQWPCPSEDHPGTKILHSDSFPIGKKATLQRIAFQPTPEKTDKKFPFLLTTGRNLYQFNAGTMTLRTKNAELRSDDFLDISPEDAKKLKLKNGQKIKIQSRYGEATLPLRINSAIKPSELFATFHNPETFLNRVTSPYRDSRVKACEYKVTAVRVGKA